MKTLAQINDLLANFEKRYKCNIGGAQQQSEAWFIAKLGVLSASNASKIVAKKDSETRHTYMCELVAQICTGQHKEFGGAALDWGSQNESAARAYYELLTRFKLTPVPFIFKDDTYREGCSPDAFVTDNRGCEIKCPYDSTNFIKFLVADQVKPEWKWQQQFTLRVTGADKWDFCEYDPRNKIKQLHMITAEKDEKMQSTLADAAPQFIEDMDKMLAQIGIKFGDQWSYLSNKHSDLESDAPSSSVIQEPAQQYYILRTMRGAKGKPINQVPHKKLSDWLKCYDHLKSEGAPVSEQVHEESVHVREFLTKPMKESIDGN